LGEQLLDLLNREVEKHKESNEVSNGYDRGFREGSLAEAIKIRAKIREFMLKKRR
jgi:hypothetical protein